MTTRDTREVPGPARRLPGPDLTHNELAKLSPHGWRRAGRKSQQIEMQFRRISWLRRAERTSSPSSSGRWNISMSHRNRASSRVGGLYGVEKLKDEPTIPHPECINIPKWDWRPQTWPYRSCRIKWVSADTGAAKPGQIPSSGTSSSPIPQTRIRQNDVIFSRLRFP